MLRRLGLYLLGMGILGAFIIANIDAVTGFVTNLPPLSYFAEGESIVKDPIRAITVLALATILDSILYTNIDALSLIRRIPLLAVKDFLLCLLAEYLLGQLEASVGITITLCIEGAIVLLILFGALAGGPHILRFAIGLIVRVVVYSTVGHMLGTVSSEQLGHIAIYIMYFMFFGAGFAVILSA